MKGKMQNYAAETVTIPTLLLGRAKAMANAIGVPVRHGQGEDFDYLSVPDVVPQFPEDDFIPARNEGRVWGGCMTGLKMTGEQ